MVLLNQICSFAQVSDSSVLLKVGKKNVRYYVDLGENEAKVYKMGQYYDPGGAGNSILDTDTLVRQLDGIYHGSQFKITKGDGVLFLIVKKKRRKQLSMKYVDDYAAANKELNNAYFLGRYFAMSDEIRDSSLVTGHSFRNGFREWDKLKNTEQDYVSFRTFANKAIAHLRDSIVSTHNKYVSLTNFLILNVHTIDYSVLKDSLMKLPKDDYLRYHWSAVSEIIKRRPEYFYKLVEDFPNDQSDIFFAVNEWDKELIGQIRAIEGHDAVKKRFVKDIRGRKYMLFHAAGMYTLIIAGVVLLLI